MPPSERQTFMPFRKACPWVFFVALAFLMNYIGRSILGPLLSPIERDMGINHGQATGLFMFHAAAFTGAMVCAGILVRMVPARRMVSCSLMAQGAILAAFTFTQTLSATRCLFFFLGAAAGFYFPGAVACLGTLVQRKDWGKAMGIHELAPSLAFICLPLIVSFCFGFTGWRGVMLLVGITIFTVGLLFFLFGKGGETPANPEGPDTGIKKLFFKKHTILLMSLLATGVAAEYVPFAIGSLYLVEDMRFSLSEANHFLAAIRVICPLLAFVGGIAADRFSSARILFLTLSLSAACLFVLVLPSTGAPVPLSVCLAMLAAQAMLIAFLFPPLFKYMTEFIPQKSMPAYIAVLMPPCSLIGNGLIPALHGQVGEHFSFGAGFIIIVALCALCAALILLIRPTDPALRNHPEPGPR